MALSFSAMRKALEQDNICDSLKGRIQYFVTRYRAAHDQTGRIAVRLDGKEIFRSDYFDYDQKRHEAWAEMGADPNDAQSELIELGSLNKGGIAPFDFYDAFHCYQNSSIGASLLSPDPVVRLFAILDKRVGKRRLREMVSEVDRQPEWLRPFYRLRLEAEGIVNPGAKE